MQDLLSLLPRLFRAAGDDDEAREQAAVAAWAAAVGPAVRRATAAMRLERKTLVVAAIDETWRAQLRRLTGRMLFKLNSMLGAPVVTGIEFVLNERVVRDAHILPHEIRPSAPDNQVLPLLEKASAIPDSLVRDAFLRAAGKCLARRA